MRSSRSRGWRTAATSRAVRVGGFVLAWSRMARLATITAVLLLMLGAGSAVVVSPPPALAVDEADRIWTVGERAFEDGLYTLSRRMLERFIERYPADRRVSDATLLLGKARFSLKQYQPALDAFRQAVTMSPPPGRPG